MLAPARLADFITGSSLAVICAELLYLRRKRSEFKWCPALIGFAVIITAMATFLILESGFLIPKIPKLDMDLIRSGAFAAFSMAAALWLLDAVIRIRDLPRLSELEQLVKERTAALQTIIDSSPIGIVEADEKGIVKLWNHAAEKLFGWKAEEVLEKPLPIIPEMKQPEFEQLLADTINNKRHPSLLTKRKHRDGHLVDVSIWNAPLRSGRKRERTAMAMFADMSQEIMLKEKLENAKLEAERANQAKSRFLANMSHEIRTPLTSILGFGELLLTEELTPEQSKTYVGTILKNGKALAQLIDDLLDLSKVEAGEMRLDPQPTSVRDLLSDVQTSLEFKATSKGLFLNLNLSDRVPGWVLVDSMRLRQVLMNIAGNALKFTEKGGVKIHVDHKEDRLCIVISDTGPGISAQNRERLFKPFSQANSTIVQKFGGTGLGLSLSKELAQLMNGDLVLTDSKEGFGSTFTVEIEAPLVRPEVVAPPADMNMTKPLDGVRILIADDAEDNLSLVSHYLTNAGATVETASDGVVAVEKAHATNFDIILLDIQMPKLDGIAAIKQLKPVICNTNVIALSAYASSEHRQRCLEAGFTEYVTKPIQPTSLINTLARLNKETPPARSHISDTPLQQIQLGLDGQEHAHRGG